MTLAATILQVQQILSKAQYAVALTGAGISTPSGIPDFRTPGSGLWERADPYQVATLNAFRHRPESFYDWLRPTVRSVQEAKPNPAHQALVELEKIGVLKAIITQNIDDLHHRAGSRRIIELHGHFRTATCIHCYQTVPGEVVLEFLMNQGGVPTCEKCGGVLKPDVILFGEQLPLEAVRASHSEARRCDLMLVAGSSLLVEPAASLPSLAAANGARLVIVNLQPTPMDRFADAVVHADVAEVLPALAGAMKDSR